ncbi:MAG: DNA polymerase I [Candidatus Coatesbacteria bacterium]
MQRQLHLIDGNSYAYRAFYAIPRLTNHEGKPTNAVYGFAVFLHRMLKEHPGDEIVVAFDPKGPTARHKVFAEYKAHRKPMPDDLVTQVPLLHDLVRAHGLPLIMIEGHEADDALATLSRLGLEAGRSVRIYSGDKDILQLVGPDVKVVVPRQEDAPMDAGAVRAKWGVPPDSIVDLLSLMGDDSDNLPGVMGVGEKTAAALLAQFGDLDALFARLDEVKSEKLRAKLAPAEAQVRRTRELAVLRTDLPVAGGIAACRRGDPDLPRLHALYRDLGFARLLASLPQPGQGELALDGGSFGPGASATPSGPAAMLVEKPGRGLLAALRGDSPVVCAAIEAGGHAFLALESAGTRWVLPAESLKPLVAFLGDSAHAKVAADAKALTALALGAGGPLRGVTFDVSLASALLGGHPLPPPETADPGRAAAAALDAVGEARGPLAARLDAEGMRGLLERVELPVAPILAAMEREGIGLDVARLSRAADEIRGHLKGLEVEIWKLAGGEFNILSPKQVGEVLFGKLKLPSGKRTKTGFSTDEAVLDELAGTHRAPAAILEYRKLSKLLGTYLEPLPGLVRNGCLHTTWHQLGAATGRISSSDPNLQNIPIRGAWGQRIRGAFVPRFAGRVLLSCDYSQIELRLLAHMAGDEPFREAFRRGDDVHAATAAEMFGKARGAVSPDERRAAKAVNFGIVYGMTAYGLSRELKCPPGVARDYLDRFFAKHPAVRAFMDGTLEGARAQGWVTTLLGRRRRTPEIASALKLRREEAEREALNHPVQGTAADYLKLAMIKVAEDVPDATLLLTIHDELLFEVPATGAKALAARVKGAMEGVASLSVPLVVEAASGASWAECHP